MAITPKPIPSDNPSGAIIAYNNLLTSTNGLDDKALSPDTYQRYMAGAGAISPRFRLSSLGDVNYIAIGAHNLEGETILISTSPTDLGTQTDLESITFKDNNPVLISFETRNIKEILFSGTMTKAIEIGVVHSGMSLQMPQNIYGGHSPTSLNEKIEYQSAQSESGQFLSRNINRKGTSGSFSWQFLDDGFIRDEFLLFKKSAQTKPFFIKWRPDFYSDEVSYCHTENIKVSNMGGGHRLMTATMTVKAHSDL